jgi:hypothetical protein
MERHAEMMSQAPYTPSLGTLGLLAVEIRSEIYGLVFEGTEFVASHSCLLPLPPLVRCSYAIREEAAQVLSEKPIIVRSPEVLSRLGDLFASEISATKGLYDQFRWNIKLDMPRPSCACLPENPAHGQNPTRDCAVMSVNVSLDSWAVSLRHLVIPTGGTLIIDFTEWRVSPRDHYIEPTVFFRFLHRVIIRLELVMKGGVRAFLVR